MYIVVETDKHRSVVDVSVFVDRKDMIEAVTNMIDALGVYPMPTNASGDYLTGPELQQDVRDFVDQNGGQLEYDHSGGGCLSIWLK